MAKGNIQIMKLNMLMAFLIMNDITFDVNYTSGTRKDAPVLQITVYIGPNVSVVYKIE